MEPISIIFISLPVLIAGVVLVTLANKRKSSIDSIQAARERAQQRIDSRQFMDTEPVLDPYRTGLDYVVHSHVQDEWCRNGLPLVPEQVRVIGLLFDQPKSTIINACNIPAAEVEYLDPNFEFPRAACGS